MRTVRVLFLPLLALTTLLTPSLGSSTAAAATGDAAEAEAVNVINRYRVSNGRRPLRMSGSLNRSAKRYSHRLMARDYFGHASRVQASSRFRTLGEVLARFGGRRYRARAAVRQWMRSAGHRFVLLRPSLRWIGAGATRGRFRGRSSTIWVVQVGR